LSTLDSLISKRLSRDQISTDLYIVSTSNSGQNDLVDIVRAVEASRLFNHSYTYLLPKAAQPLPGIEQEDKPTASCRLAPG